MGGEKNTIDLETYREELIINFITYLHHLANSLEYLENYHARLNAAWMNKITYHGYGKSKKLKDKLINSNSN